MARILFWLVTLLLASPLRAVENTTNSSYNLSPPNSTNIPSWTSGWTQPAVQPTGYTYTTGWNYVGSVNGDSAIYMGNNWVLTAAHVGPGNFTINGVMYPMVQGTVQQIGTADLVLFQINPAPNLPAIPLQTSTPEAFAPPESGSQTGHSPIAIIGWGAGNGSRFETWGCNNPINYASQSVTLSVYGTNYQSTDFITLTQTTNSPPKETGNPYEVVTGDSGGGAFVYASNRWELAGINEGNQGTSYYTYPDGTTGGYSLFVQLSTYSTSIAAIVAQPLALDTPTLPPPALMVMGAALIIGAARSLLGRKSPTQS